MLFKISIYCVIWSTTQHKARNTLLCINSTCHESTVMRRALRKFRNLAITLQTTGNLGPFSTTIQLMLTEIDTVLNNITIK